jgi:hypothetical protein
MFRETLICKAIDRPSLELVPLDSCVGSLMKIGIISASSLLFVIASGDSPSIEPSDMKSIYPEMSSEAPPPMEPPSSNGMTSLVWRALGSVYTVGSDLAIRFLGLWGSKSLQKSAQEQPFIDFSKLISDKLNWSKFPAVLVKATPDVLGVDMRAADYEGMEMLASDELLQRILEIVEGVHPTGGPNDSLEKGPSVWVTAISTLLDMEEIPLPAYEVMLSTLQEITTMQESAPKLRPTLIQIRKDSERHGFKHSDFEAPLTLETVTTDCIEVCAVYAIVADPAGGYIQGMMDYCFAFKVIGRMTNEEAFYGLTAMSKVIARLVVPGTILSDRTFVYGQLFLHMYAEMNELEHPNLFEMIDSSAIHEQDMLPGHILANGFDAFTISAGFRADPKAFDSFTKLAPLMDFIIRNGRAGLIAAFFAGLDYHRQNMEALVLSNKFNDAVRFVADPFSAGGPASLADLVSRAELYVNRAVGAVPFPTAVRIIDLLALDLVPLSSSNPN